MKRDSSLFKLKSAGKDKFKISSVPNEERKLVKIINFSNNQRNNWLLGKGNSGESGESLEKSKEVDDKGMIKSARNSATSTVDIRFKGTHNKYIFILTT